LNRNYMNKNFVWNFVFLISITWLNIAYAQRHYPAKPYKIPGPWLVCEKQSDCISIKKMCPASQCESGTSVNVSSKEKYLTEYEALEKKYPRCHLRRPSEDCSLPIPRQIQ